MKIVLITGASSGMGKCFARQFDKIFTNIDEIWLVARNRAKLNSLSQSLRHKTRVFPVDITDSNSVEALVSSVSKLNARIAVLVNSAGYGILGDFAAGELSAELGMIDLNCKALTNITHRLIPYMCKNGRIIQMASSAGFAPQPDFAVYAASKAYVLSFSRALNRELKSRQIYVTAVCPGPVNTPFFDIAEKTGTTMGIKKLTMAEPMKVVNKAIRDSYYKKDVSVYGIPIKAFQLLSKLAPHACILDCIQKFNK